MKNQRSLVLENSPGNDAINDLGNMRHLQVGVLVLGIIVCFLGVFGRDLWTPDEPRVAAITLEMSNTGDFIIPRLAGTPFVEKPPLYFDAAAALVRLAAPVADKTGIIRLTSALWALGALAMTFLIARRLLGQERAGLATIILLSMVGFVENSHWIRVDSALFFFVAASVWSFSEVYFGGRRWYCIPAGLFAAGAFLSKGVIGPLFIFFAWTGMVIPWVMRQRREKKKLDVYVLQHVLCLFVFLSLVCSWLLTFRIVGGPELWREWFWINHVGRLMGTAKATGHMHPHQPFYYLIALAGYSSPWLPLIILWAAAVLSDLWRRRKLSDGRIFLLIWSAGSMTVLTISATKRELYLLPLLPAFAIMSADAYSEQLPKWVKVFFHFWVGFCVLAVAALILTPVAVHLLPFRKLDKMAGYLGTFGVRHLVVIAALALLVFLLRWPAKINLIVRVSGATAILYISAFLILGGAFDLEKSMKADICSFLEQVPAQMRPQAAGWHFSETMLANFYYYGGWSVPQVSDKSRVRDIVAGKDNKFDSVVISGSTNILETLEPPYRIIAKGQTGDSTHRRPLIWVEGIKSSEMAE